MNEHAETLVAKEERHVRCAEELVEHQREVIAKFEALGDAEEVRVARSVLMTLEKSLELAREGLRLAQQKRNPIEQHTHVQDTLV